MLYPQSQRIMKKSSAAFQVLDRQIGARRLMGGEAAQDIENRMGNYPGNNAAAPGCD
jgi:hypothetical protein